MDPLEGNNLVARWGFEAHDRRGGEFLLRDDGVLLRRYGGATEDGSIITWSFEPWVRVDGWTGRHTVTSAEQALRAMGYELTPFSPVPIEDRTEPFDTDPPGPDPLEGANVVAHWGFTAEYEIDGDDHVTGGELLLRDDGVLMRRYGGGSTSRGSTTYSFNNWHRVDWWPGHTAVEAAALALRGMRYQLYPPSPVPIGERTAGPYPLRPNG